MSVMLMISPENENNTLYEMAMLYVKLWVKILTIIH